MMIPFKPSDAAPVSREEMQAVYEKIKTPKKLGAVMKWDRDFTDSPTVFRYKDTFYMLFVAISKDCRISGYETHIARSEDLLHWDYQGVLMKRDEADHWDSKQCAGYAGYVDIDFEGGSEILPVNGRYYISYLAGNSDGYEPDPLYMGLAHTEDLLNGDAVIRLPNPVLAPEDADTRPFEAKTLYKSCLFIDPLRTTGHPYVNVYNAKGEDDRERIFLAVSDDGEAWERYGDRAIIDLVSDDPDGRITGDPQILLVDGVYVMPFFRFRAGSGAYDTFACSRDLQHWTLWDGKPLVEPEEEWEKDHAHKPWLVRHNGKVYHFYCAVNDARDERFIAVAVAE